MGGPSGSPFFCAISAGNPPYGLPPRSVLRYRPNGRDCPQIGDCPFIPKFPLKRNALLRNQQKIIPHLPVFCSPQGCVSRKNRIFSIGTVFNGKAGAGVLLRNTWILPETPAPFFIFFMDGKGGGFGYNFPLRGIGAARHLIERRKMARLRPQWRIPEKMGRRKREIQKG